MSDEPNNWAINGKPSGLINLDQGSTDHRLRYVEVEPGLLILQEKLPDGTWETVPTIKLEDVEA